MINKQIFTATQINVFSNSQQQVCSDKSAKQNVYNLKKPSLQLDGVAIFNDKHEISKETKNFFFKTTTQREDLLHNGVARQGGQSRGAMDSICTKSTLLQPAEKNGDKA